MAGVTALIFAASIFAAEGEGAEGEVHRELPIPPVAFGITALVLFALLLAITYAFKSVGTRH